MALPEKLRHGGRMFMDRCGCEWQGQRWLKLCPQHAAEEADVHRRAMDDYHARRVSSSNEAGTSAVRSGSTDHVADGISGDA